MLRGARPFILDSNSMIIFSKSSSINYFISAANVPASEEALEAA